MLLEQQLLQCEIVLSVKQMSTATMGLSIRTLGAGAVGREATLGPKATLTDYVFHTFEPPQIIGVVIWEIKRLWLPYQGINAIAHAWPFWLVCPETLQILRDINEIKKTFRKKKMRHTFDRLGGRDGIIGMLLVAGCIIE